LLWVFKVVNRSSGAGGIAGGIYRSGGIAGGSNRAGGMAA